MAYLACSFVPGLISALLLSLPAVRQRFSKPR
jgi:hypothetical protein